MDSADQLDVPQWSGFRRGAVIFALALGGAAFLRGGVLPHGLPETIALRDIDQGKDLVLWTIAILMTGASAERVGLWSRLGKVLPMNGKH